MSKSRRQDIAELLGVTTATLSNLVAAGKLSSDDINDRAAVLAKLGSKDAGENFIGSKEAVEVIRANQGFEHMTYEHLLRLVKRRAIPHYRLKDAPGRNPERTRDSFFFKKSELESLFPSMLLFDNRRRDVSKRSIAMVSSIIDALDGAVNDNQMKAARKWQAGGDLSNAEMWRLKRFFDGLLGDVKALAMIRREEETRTHEPFTISGSTPIQVLLSSGCVNPMIKIGVRTAQDLVDFFDVYSAKNVYGLGWKKMDDIWRVIKKLTDAGVLPRRTSAVARESDIVFGSDERNAQ